MFAILPSMQLQYAHLPHYLALVGDTNFGITR
jgi:hypothetical protein